MSKINPHYILLEPLSSLNRVAQSLSLYLSKLIGGDKIFNLLLHKPYRLEKINFQPKLFDLFKQLRK